MIKIIHSQKSLSSKEITERRKIMKAFNKQFWKKQNNMNAPKMSKEAFQEIFLRISEILARIRTALPLNFPLTGKNEN